jgi:biopolymer transport protein ExbD
MKPFKRRKKNSIAMNVTPLLDVMFMLLLFFMLTSHFMKPSISLSLPRASNTQKQDKEDIIVSIDKNGLLFLNHQHITKTVLLEALQEKVQQSEKKRIIFYGDAHIFYKDFIALMDILKKSGARTIDVAHDTTD